MLLGARNRNEPSLSSRHPQLISGSEVCRRVIERADSNLNFIRAINGRKHSRPAYGTEVAIVGREHPASGLTPDRHVVCPPDGEEVAERSSLLATYLAVAKADPHRLSANLKPHLTAVAATHSLPHQHILRFTWAACVPCASGAEQAMRTPVDDDLVDIAASKLAPATAA